MLRNVIFFYLLPVIVDAQLNFTALLMSNQSFLKNMKRDEIPSSLSLLIPDGSPKYTLGKIKMKAESKGCNVTVTITSTDKASLGTFLNHFFPQLNLVEITGNAIEPKKFNVKAFIVEKCKKIITFQCQSSESFDLVKGNIVAKEGTLTLSFAYQGELDSLQYLDIEMKGVFPIGDQKIEFEVKSPKDTSDFQLSFEAKEIKFKEFARMFLKKTPIFSFLKDTKISNFDSLELQKVNCMGQYTPTGDLELTMNGTASKVTLLENKELKIVFRKPMHHKTKVMVTAKFPKTSPRKVMTSILGTEIKHLSFLETEKDVVMLELSSDNIFFLSDNILNKELSEYSFKSGMSTVGLAVKFLINEKDIVEESKEKNNVIPVQLTVTNSIMKVRIGDALEASLSDILTAISKSAKITVPPNLFGDEKSKAKVAEITFDTAKKVVNVGLSFSGKIQAVKNILNFDGLKVFASLNEDGKVWEFGAKSPQILFGRNVEVQLKLIKGKYFLQANFGLLNIKDFNSKLDAEFLASKNAKKFDYLSKLDLVNAVLLVDLQDPSSFRIKGNLLQFDQDTVELQGKVWIKDEDESSDSEKQKDDTKQKEEKEKEKENNDSQEKNKDKDNNKNKKEDDKKDGQKDEKENQKKEDKKGEDDDKKEEKNDDKKEEKNDDKKEEKNDDKKEEKNDDKKGDGKDQKVDKKDGKKESETGGNDEKKDEKKDDETDNKKGGNDSKKDEKKDEKKEDKNNDDKKDENKDDKKEDEKKDEKKGDKNDDDNKDKKNDDKKEDDKKDEKKEDKNDDDKKDKKKEGDKKEDEKDGNDDKKENKKDEKKDKKKDEKKDDKKDEKTDEKDKEKGKENKEDKDDQKKTDGSQTKEQGGKDDKEETNGKDDKGDKKKKKEKSKEQKENDKGKEGWAEEDGSNKEQYGEEQDQVNPGKGRKAVGSALYGPTNEDDAQVTRQKEAPMMNSSTDGEPHGRFVKENSSPVEENVDDEDKSWMDKTGNDQNSAESSDKALPTNTTMSANDDPSTYDNSGKGDSSSTSTYPGGNEDDQSDSANGKVSSSNSIDTDGSDDEHLQEGNDFSQDGEGTLPTDEPESNPKQRKSNAKANTGRDIKHEDQSIDRTENNSSEEDKWHDNTEVNEPGSIDHANQQSDDGTNESKERKGEESGNNDGSSESTEDQSDTQDERHKLDNGSNTEFQDRYNNSYSAGEKDGFDSSNEEGTDHQNVHASNDLEAFLNPPSLEQYTSNNERTSNAGDVQQSVDSNLNASATDQENDALKEVENNPGEAVPIEDNTPSQDDGTISGVYKRRLNTPAVRESENRQEKEYDNSGDLLTVMKNSQVVAGDVMPKQKQVRSQIPIIKNFRRSKYPNYLDQLVLSEKEELNTHMRQLGYGSDKDRRMRTLGTRLDTAPTAVKRYRVVPVLGNQHSTREKLQKLDGPKANQFPPWEAPEQKPKNQNKPSNIFGDNIKKRAYDIKGGNYPSQFNLMLKDKAPDQRSFIFSLDRQGKRRPRYLRRQIRATESKKVVHMTFAIIFKGRKLSDVLEKLYGQKMLSQTWIEKATVGLIVSSVGVKDILLQSNLFKERKIEAGLSLLVSFEKKDNCDSNLLCTDISKRFPQEKNFVMSGTPDDKGVTLTYPLKKPMKVAEKIVLTDTKLEIDAKGLEESNACVVGGLQMKNLPLKFTGGISIGDAGLLEFNLDMEGTWKKPFKLNYVSVNNMKISKQLGPGQILNEIDGQAEFIIGDGENPIKTKGRVGIDFSDPKKTFFYSSIPKVDIKQLIQSVGIPASTILPKYLASVIFPDGLVAAFTASKEGYLVPHLEVKVEQGFSLTGKVMIGNRLAASKVLLEDKSVKLIIKFRELTFSNGALVLKGAKNEIPLLTAEISKDKTETTISGVLELLGIEKAGKITIGKNGFEFNTAGKVLGIVQASIKGNAPLGEISTADFKVQGCLKEGLPEVSKALVSTLKSWFGQVKSLQDRIIAAVKSSSTIVEKAKGAAVNWQTRTQRYNNQLQSIKEHIDQAKGVINRDCVKTCGKVCLGSMDWNKKCFNVFGQWLGCPKWEHCKWRVPNLTCIAKCESDKVAKKLSTGREISRVEILYNMAKQAKVFSTGANAFVQSSNDVADSAKAIAALSEKSLKPAMTLGKKLKDISDNSVKIKYVCFSSKLSEGKSGCFLFNISCSVNDPNERQIGGSNCLSNNFAKDIADLASGELFPEISKAKQQMKTLEVKLIDLSMQQRKLVDKEQSVVHWQDSEGAEKRSSIAVDHEDDWLKLEDIVLPQYVIQSDQTRAAFEESKGVFQEIQTNAFQKATIPEANDKVFIEDVESFPSVCKQRRAILNQYVQITSGLYKLADNFKATKTQFKKNVITWTQQQRALEDRYNNLKTLYNVTDGRAEDLMYWVNHLKNSTMSWVTNLSGRFYNANKHLLTFAKREIGNVIQTGKGVGIKEYLNQLESLIGQNYKRTTIPSDESSVDDSVSEVTEELRSLFNGNKKLMTDNMDVIKGAADKIKNARSKLRHCHS